MDIATILGIVSGLTVVGIAITIDGDIGTFVNPAGLLIVLGGTLAATLVKFTLKDMLAALKLGVAIAFRNTKNDPQYIFDKAVEMAGTVRKNGLLALENMKIENELFQRGITMCTDGHNLDVIRATINREVVMSIERQEKGERMFRGIGEASPAFGMIGTLVGLIQMLSNLDDPAAIGPAMAVAMLTTFYGALIANLIAIPIADKLALKTEQDKLTHDLIVESVLQIQQGQNPSALSEILSAYLPAPARHSALAAGK